MIKFLRNKKISNIDKTIYEQRFILMKPLQENNFVKLVVEAPGDQSHPEIVAERERQKGSRKRARKLRQRMASKGKEYENNLPSKTQGQDSHHKAK